MLFHGNPPLFGCVFQYEQSVGFSLIRRAWEKAANIMSRMRCSRRSGVILYSYENDRCVVYTSPPPTAEPLLKEKPFGGCSCQLAPIIALGFRTQLSSAGQQTAQLDARAGEARPRWKYSRERMALAPIRSRRIFPAPRVASDPFQFLSN